ncbi:hypothetical protein VNO77_21178 [Canavalia gladiata]|uniref:Large ribosomal subunit protein uL11m n=1 Tax=Canavalia gladiata TaxID=3824 RepID=A0AAN9QLV5_CANGL
MSAPKAVAATIRLTVPVGGARPAPPVGPALGQYRLNLMAFCKDFNARTQKYKSDTPMAVTITAFRDNTFDFTVKSPSVSWYLKKAAGVESGSSRPGHVTASSLSIRHVYEIAKVKQSDPYLQNMPLESISKSIIGTANTMGIKIVWLIIGVRSCVCTIAASTGAGVGCYNTITCNGAGSITGIFYEFSSSYIGQIQFAKLNLSVFQHLERLQVTGLELEGRSHQKLLSSNSIGGTLPILLTNLTRLELIVISYNTLAGSLPSSLHQLINLRELRLNNNSINGTLPVSLKNLTQLGVLHISSNQLHGSIPSNLHQLTNLQELCLDNNAISGNLVPLAVGGLAQLTTINLSHNLIYGEIPPIIANLPKLKLSDLSYNNLTGMVPLHIVDIVYIDISYNYLKGPIANGFPPDALIGNKNLSYTMVVSKKCDVYSFEVVALETLVGRHPKEILSSLQSACTHGLTLCEVLDQRLP